jgi:hypothetical protein
MLIFYTRRFSQPLSPGRLSVVAGFYRPCVIDAILDHSPGASIRRLPLSAGSRPTDSSHLQFEAMLVVCPHLAHTGHFALVARAIDRAIGRRINDPSAASRSAPTQRQVCPGHAVARPPS